MKDKLIVLLVDLFYKLESEGKDGYLMLKLSVPLKVLSQLYEKLICVDVMPIEMIPEDEKLIYWNKAKEFYSDQSQAVRASKGCYILKLLTQ